MDEYEDGAYTTLYEGLDAETRRQTGKIINS
jgi:hypothetical protein